MFLNAFSFQLNMFSFQVEIYLQYLLLVFILISHYYWYRKYLVKGKECKIFKNLQFELNKSINEKELLIRELNHRVKNNLQIIVSLLNIQSKINKNPQINMFIAKSESRIKSMLLIHEMLCKSDDVTNVDFKDYLETLIKNIYLTYDLNHIEYNIDMDSVEFNIEVAIPLGLVVNELIINSFKYGFPEKRKGKILIKLLKVSDVDFKLYIIDDGVGFNVEEKKLGSIGLDIVRLLVEQMDGNIQITSQNGVENVISFKY